MKLYLNDKNISVLIDILCNDIHLIDEEELAKKKTELLSDLISKLLREEEKLKLGGRK